MAEEKPKQGDGIIRIITLTPALSLKGEGG